MEPCVFPPYPNFISLFTHLHVLELHPNFKKVNKKNTYWTLIYKPSDART